MPNDALDLPRRSGRLDYVQFSNTAAGVSNFVAGYLVDNRVIRAEKEMLRSWGSFELSQRITFAPLLPPSRFSRILSLGPLHLILWWVLQIGGLDSRGADCITYSSWTLSAPVAFPSSFSKSLDAYVSYISRQFVSQKQLWYSHREYSSFYRRIWSSFQSLLIQLAPLSNFKKQQHTPPSCLDLSF